MTVPMFSSVKALERTFLMQIEHIIFLLFPG